MAEFAVITQPPRVQQTSEVQGAPLGYEQGTSYATSAALPNVPPNANMALIIVEGAQIRWRDDGTDPTTSVGMPVYPGNTIILNNREQLTQFKAIQVSTGAKLNVSYYAK